MIQISNYDAQIAIACLEMLSRSVNGTCLSLRENNVVRRGVVLSRKLKRKKDAIHD